MPSPRVYASVAFVGLIGLSLGILAMDISSIDPGPYHEPAYVAMEKEQLAKEEAAAKAYLESLDAYCADDPQRDYYHCHSYILSAPKPPENIYQEYRAQKQFQGEGIFPKGP